MRRLQPDRLVEVGDGGIDIATREVGPSPLRTMTAHPRVEPDRLGLVGGRPPIALIPGAAPLASGGVQAVFLSPGP